MRLAAEYSAGRAPAGRPGPALGRLALRVGGVQPSAFLAQPGLLAQYLEGAIPAE